MNHRKSLISALIVCGLTAVGYSAIAQDMDVDQADTIDFQSFHKDKKEAIKVWDKNSNTTTKAYEDKPATTSSSASISTAAPATAAPSTTAALQGTAAAANSETAATGKRFEIRERYTLSRSAKTPYSAFYVIEPLYKQSAQLCVRGWKKLSERSEPIEQDFYLYYEIECL